MMWEGARRKAANSAGCICSDFLDKGTWRRAGSQRQRENTRFLPEKLMKRLAEDENNGKGTELERGNLGLVAATRGMFQVPLNLRASLKHKTKD